MFEVNAEFLQDVPGICKDIHQVRNGRALVTGDIGHARLQQGLGDGEDAFAAKLVALAEAKLLHLMDEGTFSHAVPLPCPGG